MHQRGVNRMSLVWAIICVLIVLNILVSVFLVNRDDLDKTQKIFQILIVWIIPFLGALGMWIFNRSQDDDSKPGGGSFGGGSGGGIAGGVQ
jgi:hypothetical protein